MLLNYRRRSSLSFPAVAALVAVGGASFLLVGGCGGGGTGYVAASRSVPTQATKTRVASLHSAAMRVSTQVGFASAAPQLVAAQNSSVGGGVTSAPSPIFGGNSAPQIGAFLRNVAAVPAPTRAMRLRHRPGGSGGVTRQEDTKPGGGGGSGSTGDTAPTFYYDYYLGLWTEITSTPTQTTYALFIDEAKTEPAGSIVTSQPADDTTFPQIYQSTYSFTAGYLAGSHGASTNTYNVDGSGSAKFSDTYPDGWSDSGTSTWSTRGDYTYQSRTDTGNSQWTEERGTYRADGSGGSHYAASDGYAADYTYSADGSGHGTITGPDPGLPVTISWDPYGNTTTVYADGSIEYTPGWGYEGGGGGVLIGTPVPVNSTTGSGTASSGTVTSSSSSGGK